MSTAERTYPSSNTRKPETKISYRTCPSSTTDDSKKTILHDWITSYEPTEDSLDCPVSLSEIRQGFLNSSVTDHGNENLKQGNPNPVIDLTSVVKCLGECGENASILVPIYYFSRSLACRKPKDVKALIDIVYYPVCCLDMRCIEKADELLTKDIGKLDRATVGWEECTSCRDEATAVTPDSSGIPFVVLMKI